MKLFRLLALPMLLAGCAGAASPPVGPMLPKGPLHGRLEAGVYHDVRGWFSVSTPIPPSDPGYSTLAVSEQYQPNISFVSFLPTQAAGQYYRAYVEDFYGGNHPVPAMSTVADSAMKQFSTQMVQVRNEPMQFVEERPWEAGATHGLLRLYTERTPMVTLTQDPKWLAEDYTAYILMYVTADAGKVAVLWVEWPVGCKACTAYPAGPAATGDDPIDQALAMDGRSGQFMASFHFGKD